MLKVMKWTALTIIGLIVLMWIGIFFFAPTIKGPALRQLLGWDTDISDRTLMQSLTVPAGMQVQIFASDVPTARVMRITDTGDMLVSSTRGGTITLLYRDENNDGESDGRRILLSGLQTPHGIALKDGWMYVSEETQVRRFAFNAEKRAITGASQMILTGLPTGGNHRTRTLDFGPDGRLYISIGSSCNVCVEENPFRATIISTDALGKDVKLFATGLRNAVGFDWKQQGFGFQRLFATDNGRDLLGDDTPNCELNIVREGMDYGWPWAYDNGVPDSDAGAGYREKAAQSVHPYHGFGAHRAPLGIRFLDIDTAPDGYGDAALVALHGSWNSSKLVGYKVVSLHFDDRGKVTEKDFMTGFLESDGDSVIGRPVEIIQDARGVIYISDDYAGRIYSVTWGDLHPAKEPVPEKMDTNLDTKLDSQLSAEPEGKGKDPLAGLDPARLSAAQKAGELAFILNNCGSCHIKGAAPKSAYKPLKGLREKYTIDSLSDFLKSPPSPMPPPQVDDKGRRDLAIYLLSIEEES